jgi:hypothetical protein
VNTAAGLPESPLLQEAQRALLAGDWRAGARHLEEAATIAREANRGDDATRCLQMATNLHRVSGDVSEAIRTSGEMSGLDSGVRMKFVAAAEQAESLLAAGDAAGAAQKWRAAAELANELHLPAVPRAAITRRLALCEAESGHADVARQLFAAARAAHRGAHDLLGGAWVALEHANCAQECADLENASRALGVARRDAEALALADVPEDALAHLRSELELARARLSAAHGALEPAETSARAARELALQAGSPVGYFTAAALLSQYADLREARLVCYTALATAWVTLGDVVGREIAKSWVQPLLEIYRAKWGDEAFDAVKREHDDLRRAARGATQGAA